MKDYKQQTQGTKLSLLSLAALAFSTPQFIDAGVAVPTGDWYQLGGTGDWVLEEPLIGPSGSASSSPDAAFEIEPGLNASILGGGSWDLNLFDPAGIKFRESGTLDLAGDFTVTVDNPDFPSLYSVGVLHTGDVGTIAGDGNITVTSESSLSNDPSIIVGGVVLDSAGELVLTDYTGDITVTNDNSGGSTLTVPGDGLDVLGFVEIDSDKSAVAVGVGAIDLDDPFGSLLSGDTNIVGGLNQNVTVSATSRDSIAAVGDDDDDDDDANAIVGAIGLGVVGNVESGPDSAADISVTATGSDATAIGERDDAVALTLGLALGVGGSIDGIQNDTNISAVSTSGAATSLADDYSNSTSLAASVGALGLVGTINGGEETVSITADATSGETDAEGFGTSTSLTGAIAVGLGGVVPGGVSNAEITSTATADNAAAVSGEALSFAGAVAISSGIIGSVDGPLVDTTLTSDATAGNASAEGFSSVALSIGGALAGLGPIDGTFGESAVTATSATGNADADGVFGAIAATNSVAVGLGEFEDTFFALLESLSPIGEAFSGLGPMLPLDSILPGELNILGDLIESDEEVLPSEGLAGTIDATSTSGNAVATLEPFPEFSDIVEGDDDDDELALASSGTLAIGQAGDVYGPVSAAVTATATSGNATADGFKRSSALAASGATAIGILGDIEFVEEVEIEDAVEGAPVEGAAALSGDVVATATAGDATATADNETSAIATALAEGTGDIDGNVTGNVTATATAGASTASSLFLDAFADSDADAYGTGDINGDVDAGVTIAATANGGVSTATSEFYADDDDDDDDQPVTGGYAQASSHADAYAVDGVFGESSEPTDAVEADILDEDLINVAGTFTATATSATATATGYDGADADAQAHAYGVNADDSDINANISAAFTSTATSGTALATNSGYAFSDDDDDDDDDAYADVDTRAAAIEDADDFYGSFTGSATSTATSGVATATSSDGSAYADAQAFAHGVDHDGRGSKFVGDYSAATTVAATGGTATADSENYRYGYASAEADTRVAAISNAERFEGEFTATVSGTSTAGIATATSTVDAAGSDYSYSDAYAYADAEAYGVELYGDDDDDDDDSSYKGSFDASVTLAATGGTATADASFDGEKPKDAVEGDDPFASASSESEAYASAEVAAVAGVIDYEGDFGGTVMLTATGGTATSTADSGDFDGTNANADSDAYATAEGIGLDLSGAVFALVDEEIEFDDPEGAVFDADVTITSTGGTANSTAYADAFGAIDDESVYGSAGSDASARSVSVGGFALGDDDDDDDDDGGLENFEGSLEGTHTLVATGGTADSVGDDFATAAADAETAVLQFDTGDGNSLTGGIDAVATLTSTGGSSTASSEYGNAVASADAESSFIKNVAEISGDVAATATIASSGGTAEADAAEDSRASADSDASFVDGNFGVLDGDVSGTVTVNATGTGAVAIARSTVFPFLDSPDDDDDYSADASATASAQGIDDLETIDGEVSATFNLTAVGGEAYALITEAVPGDVVEGINTLLLPSFEAYADASAEATVIDANVFGTVSSSITATVNNASAKAYAQAPQGDYASADASADATGIDGSVEVNEADDALSGNITLSTTGGLAYAELLGDEFIGDANDVVEGVRADDDDDDDDDFGSAVAYASASSIGVDGDVTGDVSSTFAIDATGGTAVATSETIVGNQQFILTGPQGSLEADATAEAIALYGSLTGDFTGAIAATATGGTAITEESVTGGDDIWVPVLGLDTVEGDGYSDGASANAAALAAGIGNGDSLLDGDVIGDITVTATGGTAASLYSNDFFLNNTYEIESDSLPTDLAIDSGNAAAGALAAGIYSNVSSEEVSGLIQATATGGTATYQQGDPFIMRPPTGPYIDTIEGEAAMLIRLGPTAGALAAGILGQSIEIDNVGAGESGAGGIIATATAGDIIFGGGIRGGPISADTIEGGAVETPIPPSIPEIPIIPEGISAPAAAFAAGIMSYDLGIPSIDFDSPPVDFVGDDPVSASSLIDVTISTFVHAFVTGEVTSVEFLREGAPSYAAAVYGAQGDDMVELAEGADIIGDINLGGGANTLTVTGNSIMEGDILSTALDSIGFWLGIDNGAGTVDFDIDSGLFTAVRTVNVSDLADAIEIASTGGIAPILSQNQEDELPEDLVQTSLINVTGDGSTDVNIAAGAMVMPVFDESVVLDGLVGQTYALITADGTIADSGAIADGSMTPYNFTTFYESDERDTFGITVDSIRVLDEEETPGTVQTSDAVATATQAVMLDMSKHASLLRSLLRRNLAGGAAAPIGAAGPDAEAAAMEQGYRTGEWLGYTSVFGNIGQQDSEGGFAGFDYDTYGFTVGFEKLFGEQLILGVAGTYADTDIDGMDGSGGGDSELYAGAVYANWFSETWFVEGGLTYGQADNDVTRIGATDLMGTPGAFRGGNDSEMVGGWAEVGYTFRDDAISYEPYARVTYIHGDHDGYTESAVGGPNPVFEQVVDDDQTENLKTELGMRIAHEWYLDNSGSFVLEGKVGWEHEWADNNVNVDTTYLGDPFELQSAESDEDAIVLGIRAEWQNGEGLALGLEYEPTFSGNWYNHTFSGTIQYNW